MFGVVFMCIDFGFVVVGCDQCVVDYCFFGFCMFVEQGSELFECVGDFCGVIIGVDCFEYGF